MVNVKQFLPEFGLSPFSFRLHSGVNDQSQSFVLPRFLSHYTLQAFRDERSPSDGCRKESKEMKITLSEEECKTTSIAELFDTIARKMGNSRTKSLQYDCTKILVSKPVYAAYCAACDEKNISPLTVTKMWASFGPKASIDQEEYLAEPLDGFIVKPHR